MAQARLPLRPLHSHHRPRPRERRRQSSGSRSEANGDIYLGSYEGWYCVGCEAYYTEKELEPGGICPLHKTPAERMTEPTYFFRLVDVRGAAARVLRAAPDVRAARSRRMNEVKSFVRGGLEDLSVSRTTFKWGVPVPDDPEHVMYVWFDALFSYYTPLLGHARAHARSGPPSRAPRRQGHPALSRGLLAGVPDVVRDAPRRAADAGLRARLSHLQRPEDEQVAAQHREAARARRCASAPTRCATT